MALLVNGEYVADREFMEEFQRLQGENFGEQSSVERLRHTAEERVIQRTLLRQMAVHAGFTVSAEEIETSAAVVGELEQQHLWSWDYSTCLSRLTDCQNERADYEACISSVAR